MFKSVVLFLSLLAFTAQADLYQSNHCPLLLLAAKKLKDEKHQDKFFMRMLLNGGPIAQPRLFYRIEPEPPTLRVDELFWDASPAAFRDAPSLSIQQLTQQVLSGSFDGGLVVKRNNGKQGRQIFFLERKQDLFTATYATAPDESWVPKEALQKGFDVKFHPDNHNAETGSFSFDATALRSSSESPLSLMWRGIAVSRLFNGAFLEYDSGIVESLEPTFKVKGMAYETRHHVIRIGTEVHPFGEGGDTGDYARIGASEYFSNNLYRDHSVVLYENMFAPVIEAMKYSPDEAGKFLAYVKQLLIREFEYAERRASSLGVEAAKDEIALLELDLLWQLPTDRTQFPTPLICESRFPIGALTPMRYSQFHMRRFGLPARALNLDGHSFRE